MALSHGSATEFGGKVFKATHRGLYDRGLSRRYSPAGLVPGGEQAGVITVVIDEDFPGVPSGQAAVREPGGTYFVWATALRDIERIW